MFKMQYPTIYVLVILSNPWGGIHSRTASATGSNTYTLNVPMASIYRSDRKNGFLSAQEFLHQTHFLFFFCFYDSNILTPAPFLSAHSYIHTSPSRCSYSNGSLHLYSLITLESSSARSPEWPFHPGHHEEGLVSRKHANLPLDVECSPIPV